MKRVVLLIVSLSVANACCAFSAYENNMRNAKVKRVALIAPAKPGQEKILAKELAGLKEKRAAKALKTNDISNLSSFSRKLGDKIWFMIYFDYEGDDYLKAAELFETSGDFMKSVNALVDPHPAAKLYGRKWLQMEWICYIRCSLSEKPASRVDAMVTTIKPEREQEYRTLHQSVWPGVIDRLARSNTRNFSIFLMESGGKLYEFFYQEYVGDDPDNDNALIKGDPVVQRWWKCTDACQEPLPGVKEIWSPMESVRPLL